MSETKWTPGPWECSPVSGIVGSLIQSDLGIKVAAAFPQGTPRAFSAPLTEANAILIAAAPDLYEEHYLDDQLLMQMATVILDDKIAGHVPFGLIRKVKQRLRRGTPALSKARGEA